MTSSGVTAPASKKARTKIPTRIAPCTPGPYAIAPGNTLQQL